MADFRKWFLVIAVVMLAAATANAQQAYTMTCATSGQTPLMRVGGLTEPTGEIDLNCDSTAAPPGSWVTAQFTLEYNATVTNAITTGNVSMAGALVAYELAPFQIQSATQGTVLLNPITSTYDLIRFPNVVLPTGTLFKLRFVNVRVAATSLVNPTFSPSGFPQVVAAVAANSFNPSSWSISYIQNVSSATVGQVVETFNFAVTDCNGSTATQAITFQQCASYFLDSGDHAGIGTAPVNGVTFTENGTLSSAEFKNIVEEDQATLPDVAQPAAIGYIFNNPSPTTVTTTTWTNLTTICDTAHNATGDVAVIADPNPPIPACTPNAWVSNGTRLLVQFGLDSRLVGKVHIWVTQHQTHSLSGAAAVLASTAADGSGNTIAKQATAPDRTCGPEGNTWYELEDAATESAAWEVTVDNTSIQDDLTFGWAVTYEEDQVPSLPEGTSYQPITISGTLAPLSQVVAPVALGSSGGSVVRFNLPWQNAVPQISIQHCVTNLLFPYVTNIEGYNTGLAISNTSLDTAWNLTDPPSAPTSPANGPTAAAVATWGATVTNPLPFNTTPQSGPCDLYLFGSNLPQNMAGNHSASALAVQAIASGQTPNIAAGQVFADTLPNIFSLTSSQTLSGYVIARCYFQFGHGFGYITSPAAIPTGYLALVIPDREIINADLSVTEVRVAQPFSNAIFDEQGEILSQ
jgi:hypothetical protein